MCVHQSINQYICQDINEQAHTNEDAPRSAAGPNRRGPSKPRQPNQAGWAQAAQAAQRQPRQAGRPTIRPAHRQASQTGLCTSKPSPARPDMVWHMVYQGTKHNKLGLSRKSPSITIIRRPLRGRLLFTAV